MYFIDYSKFNTESYLHAIHVGQSPILIDLGQPLFVWLSRDLPSVRTRLRIVRML